MKILAFANILTTEGHVGGDIQIFANHLIGERTGRREYSCDLRRDDARLERANSRSDGL